MFSAIRHFPFEKYGFTFVESIQNLSENFNLPDLQ